MKERIDLLAGKSVALSFRAPIDLAIRIMERVKQSESNVSTLTLELWRRELETDKAGENVPADRV